MPSTLIIIPGACCPSHVYNPFIQSFPPGFEVRALDTLTVRDKKSLPPDEKSPIDTPPSMYDDANHIARTVLKVVQEEGKDVVVMPHSYGGTPATEALAIIKKAGGFKVDREAKGQKGGLKGIGYMTCLVPEVGQHATSIQPDPNPNAIPFDMIEPGWIISTNYEENARLCCNLLEPSAGLALVKELGFHSARSFADPLTSMAVQGLSVEWLLCEEDLVILPEVQQGGIDRLNNALSGTGGEVKVTKVRADHVPEESMQEETRRWLVGLMEE